MLLTSVYTACSECAFYLLRRVLVQYYCRVCVDAWYGINIMLFYTHVNNNDVYIFFRRVLGILHVVVIWDSGNNQGFPGLSWNIREGWQLWQSCVNFTWNYPRCHIKRGILVCTYTCTHSSPTPPMAPSSRGIFWLPSSMPCGKFQDRSRLSYTYLSPYLAPQLVVHTCTCNMFCGGNSTKQQGSLSYIHVCCKNVSCRKGDFGVHVHLHTQKSNPPAPMAPSSRGIFCTSLPFSLPPPLQFLLVIYFEICGLKITENFLTTTCACALNN